MCVCVCVQVIIWDKKGGKNRSSDDKATPAATGREEEIQHSHQSAGEVAKLKEMLGQRDNEISILWLAAASLLQLQLISIKKYLIFHTGRLFSFCF